MSIGINDSVSLPSTFMFFSICMSMKTVKLCQLKSNFKIKKFSWINISVMLLLPEIYHTICL
jgi:hypothetical protein